MIRSGSVPKYEELRTVIIGLIHSELSPHSALPSERDLAFTYGVSRVTVRNAIASLIDDGLVYRVHGSGTYVAEHGNVNKSLRLSSFSEDMRDRGMRAGAKIVEASEFPADVRIARDLAISPGDHVARIIRVRTADGEPMALERAHVSLAIAPSLLEQDLTGSLYEILETVFGLRVERAVQQIKATVLGPDEATLLTVPAHFPALHVARVSADYRGNPIESTDSFYRADRYSFKIAVTRGHRR
jgi:GntR family transcriptional regulator